MITAKEFLKQNPRNSVEGFMIEFAKMHIKNIVENIKENMYNTPQSHYTYIDLESILNEYPVNNIK